MNIIHSDEANIPLGHYSQAIEHNGTLYLATQLGRDPSSGTVGTIEEQVNNILDSVTAILASAGSSISQVLRVTIYVSDVSLWDRVNKVYSERFGSHRPARGVIPCNDLHHGCQVAMDVIAAVDAV